VIVLLHIDCGPVQASHIHSNIGPIRFLARLCKGP